MSAVKVFERLVQKAYGIIAFCGDRMRHGKFDSKPGELITQLPQEDREALQKLTVKDLDAIKPTPGMITLLTEAEAHANQEKFADMHLRDEKKKFDKILNLPSERKKRYEH
jgi:hypothetical protein